MSQNDESQYEKTLAEVDQTLRSSLDIDDLLLADIIRVASLSDYFYRFVKTEDALSLLKSSDLVTSFESIDLSLLVYESVERFDISLRKLRQRQMCRIIFRDFTRRSDLVETTRDLSLLADACVDATLDFHYQKNLKKLGRPLNASGELQKMCVLALGKLGAQELNLSSDIDLMFFYGESGELEGGSGMSNQEFFLKTSRQIISSLDTVLSSGFVFRVDMRLRPYGDSSPLIVNQSSLENYYVDQGRDWERYAFIKARPIAGDLQLGKEFLDWLLPFIYRKQLDYGAIEALREMKGLINIEVKRKDLLDDVKLGSGGIRECEFIVQSQQLVWGGKKTGLQERRYFEALAGLENEKLLPSADVAVLKAAYIYLRNTEHGIQGENDKQTQKLPTGELSQTRLALLMGESTFDDFLIKLNKHRSRVAVCFESLLGSNNSEKEILVEGNLFWVSIWRDPMDRENMALLQAKGFEQVAEQLMSFKARNQKLQEIALNRINKLLPILLSLCASEEIPGEALGRCLKVFDAVTRRSTYLAFLLENKDAMKNLVHLCAMSPWLADRVSAYPILMYEFTSMKTEGISLDENALRTELQEIVGNLSIKDLEGQMDGLRQFKNAAQTKAATLELLNKLTVMKASDYLTSVAEIVLDKAVDLAFDYLIERHGEPCDRQGQLQGRCFAVIAYGKLGGIELAYGSDLDVVFLHDGDIQGETHGPKSVPNNVFFSRLGQRIVHILSSLTHFGLLYEVDLRLRPDGNKGPLVSTFNAYERYLNNEAWTWEQQALVRSRFVAGNESCRARFEQIRNAVISKKRDHEKLRSEVKEMRTKMRDHLGSDQSEDTGQSNISDLALRAFDLPLSLRAFDLKHSAGAIVDIEFLVQYLVLGHGHKYPLLSKWTDKVRLLETLASLKLLSPREAKILHEAYLAYRAAVHYTWLGGKLASYEQLNSYRESVVDIWQKHMFD